MRISLVRNCSSPPSLRTGHSPLKEGEQVSHAGIDSISKGNYLHALLSNVLTWHCGVNTLVHSQPLVCELGFSKHYAAKTKLCRGWDKTATAFGFPCFLILCIPWNNLLVKRWQVNVTKLNLQSTLRVMSASLRPVPPVSPGSAAGLE